MAISRTKLDTSEERRILAQMITTTSFLTKLKEVAEPKLFESGFARIVAGWVWEFFDRIGEAPGKAIEDIYIRRKSDVPDEEDAELIGEFLGNLSRDWARYQASSPEYSADGATEYFKIRSLLHLREQLDGLISSRDHANAERVVAEYRRVQRPEGSGIDLLTDANAIIRAFSRQESALFNLPGDLGQMIGPISRGDFVGILGPMKRGKSWWLWFFAYRATLLGFKSLFISCEMMEEEVTRRSWQCFLGEPEDPKQVTLPYFAEDGDRYEIGWRKATKKGVPRDRESVEKLQAKYRRACRAGEVRIEVFPSGTAGISEIETLLANLELYEGFIPDVIVIDYADILKASNGRDEHRHQLDSIWKRLRGLAQEKNCAVVTASQSGRKTLRKDVGADDISEDIRKVAHVTHLITLSATDREKEAGVMRLKCPIRRNGAPRADQVVVLTGFDIGRPYLDSRFRKSVNLPDLGEGEEDE